MSAGTLSLTKCSTMVQWMFAVTWIVGHQVYALTLLINLSLWAQLIGSELGLMLLYFVLPKLFSGGGGRSRHVLSVPCRHRGRQPCRSSCWVSNPLNIAKQQKEENIHCFPWEILMSSGQMFYLMGVSGWASSHAWIYIKRRSRWYK